MLRRVLIIIPIVPIRAPFVDVFRNVVQPKSVGRSAADPLGSRLPQLEIGGLVLRRIVAPGVKLPLQASSRGPLPFGLGRQPVRLAGGGGEPGAIPY